MKTPASHLFPGFISPVLVLLIAVILLASCKCRNEDCPGPEEQLTLRVIDQRVAEMDRSGTYVDSIDFYFVDEDQQKIHYPIYHQRHSLHGYYILFQNQQQESQTRYFLEYSGKTRTVDMQTQIINDPCCGDLLRLQEVRLDGTEVSPPLELIFE